MVWFQQYSINEAFCVRPRRWPAGMALLPRWRGNRLAQSPSPPGDQADNRMLAGAVTIVQVAKIIGDRRGQQRHLALHQPRRADAGVGIVQRIGEIVKHVQIVQSTGAQEPAPASTSEMMPLVP